MFTSQRALRGAISVAIAAGLTVSLSGCFGNPLENLTNGLVEGTVENVIEGQTGVDIDVDGDGTGGKLPDSWPSEVPVPDGKIGFSLAAGGSFSAMVTVPGLAEAEAGYENLVSSGYELVSEISLGEDAYAYGLQKDNWSVQYSWGINEDGTASVSVIATETETSG